MWKSKKTLEFVIGETREKLEIILDNLSIPYSVISKLEKGGENLKRSEVTSGLLNIAEAYNEVKKYLDLMNSIESEYKTDVLDRLELLESERTKLITTNSLVEDFNKNVNLFNSRVDGAIGQIALKEYMGSEEYKKRDRSGEKSPRYRRDIDNEELIRKYLEGTSIKQLALEHSMTENGMRLKLKSMGVWEDRRYNKEEN